MNDDIQINGSFSLESTKNEDDQDDEPTFLSVNKKIWYVAYSLFFVYMIAWITNPGLWLQAGLSFIKNPDW